MKIVGLLAARMGSTRLTGKVLMPFCQSTVLEWCVNRIRRSNHLNQLVVATTDQPEDDVLQAACEKLGVAVFRGSSEDVLDRFYRAATAYHADAIVRVTGDDPLIDPVVIDRVIEAFLANDPPFDYVSNVIPYRTYPRGQDTEVIAYSALERAWKEDTNPLLREHVTQYIVRHPELFSHKTVAHTQDYSHYRWALDTAQDFAFFNALSDHLDNDRISWLRVIQILQTHPKLSKINDQVVQKQVLVTNDSSGND